MSCMCGSHCKKSSWWPQWRGLVAALVCFILGFCLPLPVLGKDVFFLAAYVLCGWEVLVKSLRNVLHGEIFDENFLMTLATLGAFAIGEYPEGAAVMLFYQIGERLQDRAAEQSRARIVGLMDLRPDQARVVRGGQEKLVSPQEVAVGEIVRVRAGERVALDGEMLSPRAVLDLSALTGESYPVSVEQGAPVLAGAINQEYVLDMRVQKTYQNSTLARLIELAENAAAKKSKAEKFITRFARIYTPIVVVVAVLVAFIPPLIWADAALKTWVYRALIFLVISCPCALVLSVPLGFFGGIGGAAHHGILIKGGTYVEQLARLHTLALDKTGTLTQGVFQVTQICPQTGISAAELVAHVARLEAHSNHPIARAIVKKCPHFNPVPHAQEMAGKGMVYQQELAGNKALLSRFGVAVPDVPGTVVYAAKNGRYLGYILLGDPLKESTLSAVRALKKLNIQLAILSGDSHSAVSQTAHTLGITEVHAQLLPEGKIQTLENLMAHTPAGQATAFAGDGINDAPVLARADVGIAMGALGSDAALEAADVVLMTDDLQKIGTAVILSRKTLRIIRQNIGLALGVKAAVLTLGLVGLANMWGAVFADVGVSLLAVANSLRTLYFKE